jgi:hypothetical protein
MSDESSAAVAGKRVQAIIEAAEATACEIEQNARAEAAARTAALQAQVDEIAAALDSLRSAVDAMAGALPTAPTPPAPKMAAAEPEPVAVAVAAEPESEPEPEPEPAAPEPHTSAVKAPEGARLIALNMALSGTPREETARYLRENMDLDDQDELLDEVYAKAGS